MLSTSKSEPSLQLNGAECPPLVNFSQLAVVTLGLDMSWHAPFVLKEFRISLSMFGR